MTRAEFMARLRKGLVGMPTAAAAEIAADLRQVFLEATGYTGPETREYINRQ